MMGKMIRVAVADISEDFRKLMAGSIGAEEDMTLVATADNGEDAIRIVKEQKPDVLVTNLVLRSMDGMTMLRSLKEAGKMPRTIVVSSFFSELQTGLVSELGVDCFITKPCRIERIVESIRECSSRSLRTDEKGQDDAKPRKLEILDQAMQSIGERPYFFGYKYLITGFDIVLAEPDMLVGVTKILYPRIARVHGTSAVNVERCIRSAIDYAWGENKSSGRETFLKENIPDICFCRPGNVRFMKLMLDYASRRGKTE